MDSEAIDFTPAVALAELIRVKKNSPVEYVRALLARIAKLGAIAEEVSRLWAKDGPGLIRFFWSAHMASLARYLPKWEAEAAPGFVACIKHSENVSRARYQGMRQRKMVCVANVHRWFGDWDFLLTPSVSSTLKLMPDHWPTHAWCWILWAGLSYPSNMCCNPATSVPWGFTPVGLPTALRRSGRAAGIGGLRPAAARGGQASAALTGYLR